MAQVSRVWQEANELIEQFKKEFESKFGFSITIHFRTKTLGSIPPISLQEIIDELEYLLDQEYPEKELKCSYGIVHISNGIRTNTRAFPIVLLRQIFCYIAHELGYSSVEIGRFLGKDHATVLHSVKAIKIAIEMRDKSVVNKYTLIKSNLVVKYGKSKEQESDPTGSPEGNNET